MSRQILFIFEGERAEVQYSKSIKRNFFEDGTIIVSSYCNDIYELYKELEEDPYLDIFELVKVKEQNKHLLDIEDRDSISEIFLFFDLEIQDNEFCFEKLNEMLEFFNEETESGKLYISYPMFEALRDIVNFDDFKTHFVHITDCVGRRYKGLSAERGLAELRDYRRITKEIWLQVIHVSIDKVKHLGAYTTSDENLMQIRILSAQKNLVISAKHIAILSSFPIFLYDYFGVDNLV